VNPHVCEECQSAAEYDTDSDLDVCYPLQRCASTWRDAYAENLAEKLANCQHGGQHPADVAGVPRYHAGSL
jgi:hypothetical protein